MNHSFLFISFFFFLLSLPCFHASRITPTGAPRVIDITNTPSLEHGITKKYTIINGYVPWTQSTITFALSPSHTIYSLSQDDVKDVIRRSFAQWGAVIPLKFVETEDYENADIKIAFYSGDHGDGYPFDGPLGTLAWGGANPPYGEIHLDADETWSIDFRSEMSRLAMDLETVVIHEIGHVLGLGHSSNRLAVMYASLPARTKRDLTSDDILGAQALYGTNPSFVMGSFPPTNSNSYSNPKPIGGFGFFHGWRLWVLLSVVLFCILVGILCCICHLFQKCF